jgi:hypothetical protein
VNDGWVERLLEDLEQQAVGQFLLERDQVVGELEEDTARSVGWADRLRGSLGSDVSLTVQGYGQVSGRLERVGRDWCALRTHSAEVVVLLDAVMTLRRLEGGVVGAESEPVLSRLGVGSFVRGMVAEGRRLRMFLRDGTQVQGRPLRAGADFVEIAGDAAAEAAVVVPLGALAALSPM